jgi:hypothetical protein
MFLKFPSEERDLANWTNVLMIISELCILGQHIVVIPKGAAHESLI